MGYDGQDPSQPLRFQPRPLPANRTQPSPGGASTRPAKGMNDRTTARGAVPGAGPRSARASQQQRQSKQSTQLRQSQPLRQSRPQPIRQQRRAPHRVERAEVLAAPLPRLAPVERVQRPPKFLPSWFVGRHGAMRAAAAVGALVMIGRVVDLQFFSDGDSIITEQRRILSAARGDFFDRNGQPLAVNDAVADVYLDAKAVGIGRANWGTRDRASLESSLQEVRSILGLTSTDMDQKIATNSRWVQLRKGISAADAKRVRAVKSAANIITVEDQPRRVYPDGDITRGIIGSVHGTRTVVPNTDGKKSINDVAGKSGLEKQLDAQLTGIPGELLTERAPGNREIPSPKRRLVSSVKGTSYTLTIDRALQYQTDQVLRKAIDATGAAVGYIGVMDVETGDVLASVAMSADAKTGEVKSLRYNFGAIYTYEPGSTMKPFTMAAALDSGALTPSTRFNVEDHLVMSFRREQKRFKDDVPHPVKYWSIRDILVNSSNIGTIKVARRIGPDAVNNNLKQFGFGVRSGVGDAASESPGIMKEVKDWSGVDIGTVPIGQGIAVTPFQMLAGMNTLAADGEYVSPRIIQSSTSPDGKRTDMPSQKRRVVSSGTAAEMRSILADVTSVGTGRRASVDGYEVAGKTGTAQKPEKGRYSTNAYIASFAGFYPASNPKISMLVILDEPYEEYGGLTAAPVFSEMVRITAQRYRIAPQTTDKSGVERPQVLVTPELKAVTDPSRKAVAPVRSVPTSSVALPTDAPPVDSAKAGAVANASPKPPTVEKAKAAKPAAATATGDSVDGANSSRPRNPSTVATSAAPSTKAASATSVKRTPSSVAQADEPVKPKKSAQPQDSAPKATKVTKTTKAARTTRAATDEVAAPTTVPETGAVGVANDAVTEVGAP
jgi:cell division protein FtsI (penicillin-binding protein 3)